MKISLNPGHCIGLDSGACGYGVEESNFWRSDLFVSIHCNAANGYARGTETFYFGSYEGKRLAECIQNQIVARAC